ncbi:Uncharacterized conserved protein, DUF2147 family [Flavobacterium sp. CF108]|uniref:DUF2147 domain-containing protein n=1 Tax=unclassified Flavobacterium TaxID=196869 RepID=UPI0008D550CA|nr:MULTISPECIES: DUF2147 domain-containing protein [unclassified Flavobacterium]SEO55114.1 Uncharacterized conserved protein, DUF2147 family [Flavobacterium sp. fv08]SHH75829.1 Uncharacterized conserved protein, DUF2147 family [Flavobacterium sp. CF108]
MKKMYLALILLILTISNVVAQNTPSDKIEGVWLSEEKDVKIEIYKSGNKYFGKLIWGKTMYEADGKTSKKDVKNKNEKLRSRNLKDLIMLKDFEYNDGVWDGGEIYDAYSGKTYSCTMKLEKGKLNIRGYIGISLLGRTAIWEKVK